MFMKLKAAVPYVPKMSSRVVRSSSAAGDGTTTVDPTRQPLAAANYERYTEEAMRSSGICEYATEFADF